jgi:hypothetical protein
MPEPKIDSGKLLENIIHMAEDIVARTLIETIQNSAGVGRAQNYWFNYISLLGNLIIKDDGNGVPPEHYEAFFGLQELSIHKDVKEKSKFCWGHKVMLGLSKSRIVIVEARHNNGTYFHEIWWKDEIENKVYHEPFNDVYKKLGFDDWKDILDRCGDKPLQNSGVLIYIPDIEPQFKTKLTNEYYLTEVVLRHWRPLIQKGVNIHINNNPVNLPDIKSTYKEDLTIETKYGIINGDIIYSSSEIPNVYPQDKIAILVNEYMAHETMFGLPIPQDLKGHITGAFNMDFIEKLNIKTTATHGIDTSNPKWDDLCSYLRPHIHKIFSNWIPKVRTQLSPRTRERLKTQNKALNNCWKRLIQNSPNKDYWKNITLGLNPYGALPGQEREHREKGIKEEELPIPTDICPFCGEKFANIDRHIPYCNKNPDKRPRIRSPKKTKNEDSSAKIQYWYYNDSSNPKWISRLYKDMIQINKANPLFKVADRRHMTPYHDVYAVGNAIIKNNPPITNDIQELPEKTIELLDEFIILWWEELENESKIKGEK